MFLFRKKKKQDSKYPGFIGRMFSAVLDLMLASIVIIPICHIIYGTIYDGPPPSQEYRLKLETSYKNKTTITREDAFKNLGDVKWYVEQFIQISLLGLFVLFFWNRYGATPGKMMLHMRIVDHKTLGKPTRIQYFLRLIGYVVSAVPVGLGIFYILLNKKHRAWHDLIAGTVVISTKYQEKK